MQYTVDPELITDVPLIAQLAEGLLLQWAKSAKDKTFRNRLIQSIHGKPLRLGKVKAVSVWFHAYRGVFEDVPFETAYPDQVPEGVESLEVVFDLCVRPASNFDLPVLQVSIPLHRSQL